MGAVRVERPCGGESLPEIQGLKFVQLEHFVDASTASICFPFNPDDYIQAGRSVFFNVCVILSKYDARSGRNVVECITRGFYVSETVWINQLSSDMGGTGNTESFGIGISFILGKNEANTSAKFYALSYDKSKNGFVTSNNNDMAGYDVLSAYLMMCDR